MRYATIVADPPWPIREPGARSASDKGWRKTHPGNPSRVPYPTMSLAEIAALPVADLAAKDAHLYVWTINQFLRETYDIVRNAWGFTPSTLLTWCKAPMGIGYGGTFVSSTEFIVFARRGTLKALRRWDRSHFDWKRPYEGGYQKHSGKPEGFQDVVEVTSPGPYLELFARRQRLGWHTWGNEALNRVTLDTAK